MLVSRHYLIYAFFLIHRFTICRWKLNWVLLVVVCGLTLVLSAILFLYRERKKDIFSEIQIDLCPAVHITSFDGWQALELQLVNRSDAKVWIEEANLVITDLEANFQTALATGQYIGSASPSYQMNVYP